MKRIWSKQVLLSIIVVVGISIALSGTFVQRGNQNKNVKNSLVEHLDVNSFKEKICDCSTDNGQRPVWRYKGANPAVIDFYADWCGPCRMVSPILEELAVEYHGRIKVYKINTDQQQELAQLFGISGLPSMLFIPSHGTPRMTQGALSKEQLKQAFQDVFNVGEPSG